jgi:hypothetical protein
MTTPAVIYGVKSSPDEKESVADQHKQVLAAIEKEETGSWSPSRSASPTRAATARSAGRSSRRR